jgi:hypothetical protein
MADRNKFEEMLDLLINEDKDGAEALFHEIVVEKSRDIYESLLEDEAEVDESDDEVEEAADEEVDESDEDLDEATDEEVDESDEEVEEGFDLDEFEVEADPMGGDAADKMIGDIEGDDDMDMDMDDEGEEGDVEDRVEDLEDALDDLKAEFEKMMAGDDEGDDMDDMGDDEGEEEPEEAFAFEATDEEVDESDEEVDEAADEDTDESSEPKSAGEQMREYVEKVSATMGDNGANTKSAVAGKNDMGGTAGNLVQGETADESGTSGGLANPAEKEDNAGNVNVPGGKASKSMKPQPGHGAEKKGKPETADNKKSVVGK